MATPTIENETQLSDSEIGQALIEHCQIPAETVQKIVALGRDEKLNFVEAALRLGVVSDDAVEDAVAWRRRRFSAGASREKPGLIEFALSKMASRRVAPEASDTEPVVPCDRLIPSHHPERARGERLRALCTELLLHAGADAASAQRRVLAIVSPGSGEGRSQLAAEMAIGFSQLGRETLLIDADLRNPQQHNLFGTGNQSGLSQMLAGKQAIKMQRVKGLPLLHLLTSGTMPDNPLELLSDGRMARLITLLRGTYEFVVIDTPPINKYADGLAIATSAKEALVVSRAHRTTHKSVHELLRRFAPTRAKMVGAIVNYF